MKSSLRPSQNQVIAILVAFTFAGEFASLSKAEAQDKNKGAKNTNVSAPAALSSDDASKSEKLDVTGLEQKYWAAKDTDFSVVQNRLFSKAGRTAFSIQYGGTMNETWSDGPALGLDLNYYFSERYGVQLEYDNIASKNNKATNALIAQRSTDPDHNLVKGYYGAGFNWVPFYGKISLLNTSIIYFDMSITPGLGVTNYDQIIVGGGGPRKSAPTVSLDLTQHFFLNKWIALRFDVKNRWYQEDVLLFTAPSAGASRTANSGLHYESLVFFGLTLYY